MRSAYNPLPCPRAMIREIAPRICGASSGQVGGQDSRRLLPQRRREMMVNGDRIGHPPLIAEFGTLEEQGAIPAQVVWERRSRATRSAGIARSLTPGRERYAAAVLASLGWVTMSS